MSRIALAIKKCEARNDSWDPLAVSMFRGGICNDYAMVRAKAKKAEETSDLQSDAGNGKRKIIPRRYSSSEESGQELMPLLSPSPQMEEIIEEATSLLPPPPKMRKAVIRSDVKICYIKITIT